MASITNTDIPPILTQKKTTKRKSGRAAGLSPSKLRLEMMNRPPNHQKGTQADQETEQSRFGVDDLKKTPGSRLGNYIAKEDVQICLSWLETTEDPLNSTNQSGVTFWDQVHGHYMEQIILANQSGKTIADWIPAALKLDIALNKDKGKDYTHMQCYHSLDCQKWLDYSSDTTAVPSMRLDDTYWPPGNKKAKDAWAEEAKNTKWKDNLIKVNRDLANHSESQSAILAEQKDALIAMSDEATMLINLDSIPDSKQEFFEWRQHKFIEKMKKAKANEAQKKKEDKEKKKTETKEKKKKDKEEEKKMEEEEKKKKEDEQKAKEATQMKTLATSKKNTAV
ncbi:hypothetical protein PSTG_03637 [Puccinia striiformis f. sp. tritici PST-78]|uniref:No apical meristem-associated C-terminal domain-containing protein n=1 Tax=Puccinia striiformis f. sp. tritici PST-78 TaxID=1165861 RepID=A0A0L0VUS7_9BASI|nr:hypothetical protein PSTG_03637 [Puccinia striiformis f. sp. tritici PST-78]